LEVVIKKGQYEIMDNEIRADGVFWMKEVTLRLSQILKE